MSNNRKTNDNQEESLEEYLLNELKCPLCEVFMSPPIQQCAIGHDFCKECFELINNCSRCYSPKGTTRNHLLEKLSYKINLPCKYSGNGCDFQGKSQRIKAHESTCTYDLRKCPFNFTSLCSWRGIVYDIEDHCEEFHSFSYTVEPVSEKCFISFDTYTQGYTVYMIFAYNSVFRFLTYVESGTKLMQFATTYLGRKLDDNRFSFEIKFLRNGTKKAAITLKATCDYLNDHTVDFINQNYLVMPLEVLKPFCDCEGDLYFNIRIIDNYENGAMCQPTTSKALG